jgi:ABC-type sugar transport system permease subunit
MNANSVAGQTLSQAANQRKKGQLWRRIRKNWAAYFFISPFFILYSIFGLFGILFSLYISFHHWDGLVPMKYRGFGNYTELFQDEIFWESIRNTLILLLFDFPVKVGLPLLLAVALNSKLIRGRGFFRTAFYVPEVTSAVVVAVIFRYLFDRDTGIINYAITLLGGENIAWLQDPFWAKVSFVLLSGWWSQGYHMIIFLAALQTIPSDLLEAAMVDGANHFQSFMRITLPLLRPIIIFSIIITTIAGLQRFGEPFLLTGGGPGYSTYTIVYYLYQKTFVSYRLGYGAAMGYMIFLMIFVFSILQFRYGSSRESR